MGVVFPLQSPPPLAEWRFRGHQIGHTLGVSGLPGGIVLAQLPGAKTSPPPRWSGPYGTIGRSSYADREDLKTIIVPSGATSVTLGFLTFYTDSGDRLSIYECTSIRSCCENNITCASGALLLCEASGKSIPSAVTSSTGIMLLVWSSNSFWGQDSGITSLMMGATRKDVLFILYLMVAHQGATLCQVS